MEKMILKSMIDYVLEQEKRTSLDTSNSIITKGVFFDLVTNYARFLSMPLTLGMFVPCDEDDNVLEKPFNYDLWVKRSLNTSYDLDWQV